MFVLLLHCSRPGQQVPADSLLSASAGSAGQCFVETGPEQPARVMAHRRFGSPGNGMLAAQPTWTVKPT